jgi:predicted secreted protein
MGWVSGIVVYLITWWVVLFAVLPWGVRPPDEPEAGHATSAPTRPRIWMKFAVTTVVAAVIWLGIYGVIEAGWISFRDMAERLPQ